MKKYTVKQSDLIGQLEGFPIEVVQKMVDYQADPDVSVFQKRKWAGTAHGGFSWGNSQEGMDFWDDVIGRKNFKTFFDVYPKNTYPKVMWISDFSDFRSKQKRVVFMEKNGKFLAWVEAETFEDAEKVTDTCSWNHAQDIEEEQIVELTIQDISEGKGKGVPPHLIRIKK